MMLPGPVKEDCPCGCGSFGTPKKKAWRDGLHHVRSCPCKRCVGGRQRGLERKRVNSIAKRTGGSRDPLSGQLSGADGRVGLWVYEETSNVAVCRGFRRWIESKGVESKMRRTMGLSGVNRALILSWSFGPNTGTKPRWVVMPYEDWATSVQEPDKESETE